MIGRRIAASPFPDIPGGDGDRCVDMTIHHIFSAAFLYDRKARPVTGYGTLNERSIMNSLWNRAKVQLRGFSRVFYKTDHYEDSEDNLVK